MKDWLKLAMRRDIVLRGLNVAAIVGTILVAINQGDLIFNGQLQPSAAWKIPLTYLVPYCVATYGGVSAIRGRDAMRSRGQGMADDQ